MNNHDDDDDDNGAPRRVEGASPPFPPTLSCIAAIGIVSLIIFMGFLLTMFVLFFFIIVLAFCWMMELQERRFRRENLEVEDMEDSDVVNGDPQDDERAVRILERFFRAVKGKERGREQRKKDDESRKELSPIECFGSEEIAELGYSECTICLEEFQKGEKCLIFPDCSHIFHCKCIVRWLKKNPTCPVCRYSVATNGNGLRGNRRTSFQGHFG